jgi:hypothetical protein
MHGLLLLCLAAAGPFPLPSLDGKALSASPKQTSFRVPLRFDRVRAFYEEQFPVADRAAIRFTVAGSPGRRTLTLQSSRSEDSWRKAVVREGDIDTMVEVTPLIRLEDTTIEGNARPLVQFVIGRSADVNRAVNAIGEKHVDQIRR